MFGREFGVKSTELINDIQIADGFPDVTVPLVAYSDFLSLLESPTSTASSTFRKVIKLLIPDAKVWAELTGSKVQLEYSNQVLAAFGLFFFSILK